MNDANITDPPVRHQRHKISTAALAAVAGFMLASVIAGALTREKPLDRAIAIATEYTRLAMLNTVNCATVPVYGVQLEQTLGTLISMISD